MNESLMLTIVSGLPRSGTSLMMQMLASGGLSVQCDEHRLADEHNPHGYYEDSRVKSLESDNSWIAQADGKAIKVVSLLLYHLPADLQYRVIFMRRDLDQVLRSQQRMLSRGIDDVIPPALRNHFEQHLTRLQEWLARQPHFEVLDVEFRDVIENPRRAAENIAAFLGMSLDIGAMTSVVDPSLYRQR